MSSGFENLPNAIPDGVAFAPITPDEAKFQDPWSDEVAKGIVIADIDAGIAFEQAKNFVTNMELADDLIRGYVRIRPWPNTDKARSALSMPIVLEAIEKILPYLHLAVWGSGKDPFLVQGVGKTKPEAARAWQALARWAVRVSDLKEQDRLTKKSILTYGYGAMTDGWDSDEHIRRNEKYRKTADGKGVERNPDVTMDVIAKPTVDNLNLRNVIFDPSCSSQDPRKGRFVAKRYVISAYDLQDMREDATYDEEYEYDDEDGNTHKATRSKIPSDDVLRSILANHQESAKDSMQALKPNQTREYQAQDDKLPSSKDPLQAPLEYVEYYTKDRCVGLLQRSIVIRNEPNKTGRLPIFGCAFIDVLNSLFGFGIARLLNGEQRFQQGVLNTWVDSLALILNPVFQQLKGMSNGGQNISIAPGKVITTEGELKALITPDISAVAQNAIEASEQRANRRVGAEGGANMPTQAMRTGTGVQAFQGDITQRLQYFMEQYLDLVFVPVIKAMLEHICENLTPDQINQILGDETGKGYDGADILDVYNADIKIEILAGVKLTTKQAAAQMAPLIIQLVANQAVQGALQAQGIKFAFGEFAEEWFELMGWNIEDLFVPMTPEDEKRAQQNNAALIKAQMTAQQMNQAHANDLDTIDKKSADQASIAVLKSTLKEHEQAGVDAQEGNNGQ